MFKGNKIYKLENGNRKRVFFIPGLHIKFKGKNACVEIKAPYPKFSKCMAKLGNNSVLKIGSSPYKVRDAVIFANGDSTNVLIGDNFSATGGLHIHSAENTCKIGDNCMFGRNIILRCTDGHSVLVDDKVANPSQDVEIGDNVWLADDVTVLKGVNIPNNCVIGIKSLVSKSLENECGMYAGAPAKFIKKISGWKREAPAK